MEKFQVATKADLKEAAIIESRRRYEEERRTRIFNDRNRIFGVITINFCFCSSESIFNLPLRSTMMV